MTNASASLLEQAREQQTRVSVVIDCANGIEHPRWSLIAESFYAELSADLEDAISIGPVFHVKEEGLTNERPFNVCIKLKNAVFASGPSADYEPLFHSTSADPKPVSVSILDDQQALVTWNGSVLTRCSGWDRWIVKLRVKNKASSDDAFPLYLGFTCLKNEKKTALQEQLMPEISSLVSHSVTPEVEEVKDALKLRVRIELEGEDDPWFPDLFKPGKKIGLPDHVYLEPLISVKGPGEGRFLELEFTSDNPIFFSGDRSICNPGVQGKDPLALAWMGLTNQKECEPPEGPVSRGFVTSWIDPTEKIAAVRWQEPMDDAERQRIASFFFVNRAITEGDPLATGTIHFGNALIDPTIVYDKDDPPKGLR